MLRSYDTHHNPLSAGTGPIHRGEKFFAPTDAATTTATQCMRRVTCYNLSQPVAIAHHHAY